MAVGLDCPTCKHSFFVAETSERGETPCPQCGQLIASPAKANSNGGEAPRLGVLVGRPAAGGVATPPEAPAPSSRRLTNLVVDIVKAVVTRTPGSRPTRVDWSPLALTLGLTALAITWPLRAWTVGLALAGLGLLLGAVAVYLSLARKDASLGLAMATLVVNTQALIMAAILARMPEPQPTPVEVQVVRLQTLGDLRPSLQDADPAVRAKTIARMKEAARDVGTGKADLLHALADADGRVRAAAAEALGHLGPGARIAYPALTQIMHDDLSAAVRIEAERALKRISPPTRDDLAELLALLKDSEPAVRAAAAQALALIGPEAKEAGPALDKAVADVDPMVRVSAAEAIAEILPAQAKGVVPKLVNGLEESSPLVRSRAAAALGELASTDAKAIEALEKALADDHASVRLKAAWALGAIGPAAQPAAARLTQALQDPEARVRLVAAQSLWTLAKQTDGVAVLSDMLQHKDVGIRGDAAVALERMGKAARDAVPALAAALKDSEAGVRARAAKALYYIGPDAGAAVPALEDALESSDPTLRSFAAIALGGLGPEAARAVPRLRKALEDSEPGLRLSAAQALWAVQLRADEVLPVLTKLLKEKDAAVRARAAAVLSRLGSKASPAVADLFALLEDEDITVRVATVKALGEIGGPLARATYPTLSELTKDDQPDEGLRRAAAETLKKIGRPGKTDAHSLINALEHPHAGFRASVAVSLWLLNRDAKPAVPALSKRLSDVDENVRSTAAIALAAIGPDAAEAVPDLIAALKQKDDELLRSRAAYTLGEIGARAAGAVEALNRVLAGEDEKLPLRVYAAQSLWAIGQQTRDVIPVLSNGIEKIDEEELRVSAAETLGKIAAKVPAADAELRKTLKEHAVPALLKGLQDEDDNLRIAAAGALGAMGAEAQGAVPLLLHSLEDDDAEIRAAICDALGRIADAETQVAKRAQHTKATYSALLFFSKVDQNDRVQRAANAALTKIGRPGPEDVDVLLGILEDKNQPIFFRNAAAQVLGIVGPEANKGVTRLGRILKNREDPGVRVLAAYALGEIGADAKTERANLLAALKDADPGLQVAAAYSLGEIFAGTRMTVPGLVPALQEAANSPEENVIAAARAALKKINP